MPRIRNSGWKLDKVLDEFLRERVRRNYQRKDLLVEVLKLFPQYAWSMRSLAYRLEHFGVRYINYNTDINEVYDAVNKELKGPGQKLGYRAMNQKLR